MANEQMNEERTETATAYRREEFRKQGTVALSRELVGVFLLFGVGLSMYAVLGASRVEFLHLTQKFFQFGEARDLSKPEVLKLTTEAILSLGAFVWPALAVAMVAGILGCVSQVGFYLTWEPLSPNFDRINPVNGFQKLFSGQGPVEGLKALIKVTVIGVIGYRFIVNELPMAAIYFQKGVAEGMRETLARLSTLFFSLVAGLSVLALADWFYQRHKLESKMKMTRREAKEEFKLREGDPLIKSRIRSIQRKLANRRMMDAIPKADVIITNPTHFAVALKYDAGAMPAPKVVAKGTGEIALKIRELARLHHVPIVENKPLARTLYKEMEIGEFIPKELYKAVAQVLSYVYRLKGITQAKPAVA